MRAGVDTGFKLAGYGNTRSVFSLSIVADLGTNVIYITLIITTKIISEFMNVAAFGAWSHI